MKLQQITESIKYHGTPSIDKVAEIMKNGLEFGHSTGIVSRDANYLGSISQALAYGPYIIEVQLNDETELLADEDAILAIANPDDKSWTEQVIGLPPDLRKTLHRIAMQEGGWWAGFSKVTLADLIRKYQLKVQTDDTIGTAGNVCVQQNIGFDGPNRISAIYELQKTDQNVRGTSEYKIVRLLYGHGSLHLGDVVTGFNEKMMAR